MKDNVSFYLKGGRSGVLLIHGLTGTPAEMHILGSGLNRAGFSVYGVQLAGHCGSEADLLKTTWKDWYQSVNDAVDMMLQKVDTLFVGGLSMGALLALKVAADRPDDIKGVASYSVTFSYDGWSMPKYVKYGSFLLQWMKFLNVFQDRVFIEKPPYGLKDERIRKNVSESMLSGDSKKGGLAGNPIGSLAEMYDLVHDVRRQLNKVKVPTLVMHASHDDIADIKTNGSLVARSVSGPVHFVSLENSYHLITIDKERRTVIKESVNFFNQLSEFDTIVPTHENYHEMQRAIQ